MAACLEHQGRLAILEPGRQILGRGRPFPEALQDAMCSREQFAISQLEGGGLLLEALGANRAPLCPPELPQDQHAWPAELNTAMHGMGAGCTAAQACF